MTKKRISRKELLKEPDEFFSLTGRLINWVRLHPKPLVYGGCAILMVMILVSGYGLYQKNRAGVSADLLGKALLRYQQLAHDGDAAQALAAVVPDFDRLTDKFGRYPAGRLGALLYAHYSLQALEHQKAVALYTQALKHYQQDPSLTPVILHGLASAHQGAGDADQAVAAYAKILSLASNVCKDSAMFQLGRLYAMEGRTDESKEVFQRLIDDYPDSNYAQLAREQVSG